MGGCRGLFVDYIWRYDCRKRYDLKEKPIAFMQSDIVNLRSFYKTPLGRVTERSIAMAMASQWKPIVNERLLWAWLCCAMAQPLFRGCGAKLCIYACAARCDPLA